MELPLPGGPDEYPEEVHFASPPNYDWIRRAFTFRYDFLGRIAERIDTRGVAMRYRYDDLGRLASIEVGKYSDDLTEGTFTAEAVPPNTMHGAGTPPDMIGYVEFTYPPDMKSFDARAYASRGGALIAHNRMEHDPRGNLKSDWQSLGAEIVSSGVNASPRTEYVWECEYPGLGGSGLPGELEGNPGFTRLSAIKYPRPPNQGPIRFVTLGYGTEDSLSDRASRIETYTTKLGNNGTVSPVATFDYIGASQRWGLTLGNDKLGYRLGLDDDPGSGGGGMGVGLRGMDRFGRLTDLHWKQGAAGSGSGATLTRVQYTYDLAGNRLTATRTPSPAAILSGATHEAQINAYDLLDRLISCEIKEVASGSERVVDASEWDLDLLGNWDRRVISSEIFDPVIEESTFDDRNQILEIERQVDGSPTQAIDVRYDAAGNLIFDGAYAYKYDAWNRLVQVSTAHIGTSGVVVAEELVKHHTYDGLGRLVRTVSPYPSPTANEELVRSERFYYDGIRRIQEVISDPFLELGEAAGQGEPEAKSALSQNPELELQALTVGSENSQLAGFGQDPGQAIISYLCREYVWGPGDRGVDELLVQFDEQREPTYVLQDAGLDCIAVADTNGGGGGGTARLVGEVVYDAYGRVLAAATLHPHAHLHAGHKGLFLDRLDEGVVDENTYAELPRLAAGSDLSYYVRNRHLHPQLGRWLQRDPNAVGSFIIEHVVFAGGTSHADLSVLALGLHLSDGVNLYEYVGSDPWQSGDPLGLQYDPFDWADAYLAERAGNATAMLEQFTGIANTAKTIAMQIAQLHPGVNLLLTMHSFATTGQVGVMDLLSLTPGIRALIGTRALTEAKVAFAGASGALLGARSSYRARGATHWLGNVKEAAQRVRVRITSGPRNYVVYIGHKGGRPAYVGITSKFTQRQSSWKGTYHLVPVARILTYLEAKGMEQVIILANPHFENGINSVSPTGKYEDIYEDLLGYAYDMAQKLGVKIEY